MICVSIQERNLQKCLEMLKNSSMAELRADLCGFSIPELEKVVASHPNLIVACRVSSSSVEFAREQIITAIRKGARFVDIEVDAPLDFLEYVKAYAQANSAKVIISYHNFEETPSLNELKLITDICRRKGADIVKIVTTANNISDAVRVLQLYKMVKDVKLLAFSMGKLGQFTRYLSLKLGAPYTYCAYGEREGILGLPTAPGQYSVEEMESLLKRGNMELNYSLGSSYVELPCSKSIAQRAVIAAAFAQGESMLSNFELCNDTRQAIEVIKYMGCGVQYRAEERVLVVNGRGGEWIAERFLLENDDIEFKVGESGLLARLMIPFAGYLSGNTEKGKKIKITGCGSILGRNFKESANAVCSAGMICVTTNNGYLPFEIEGGVSTNHIVVDGGKSSQIVSGFLMMLPLLSFDSVLHVENPKSLPYINLTLDTLSCFGVKIRREEETGNAVIFYIKGNQQYTSCNLELESDWSCAAVFAVAYAIASMRDRLKYTLKNMPIATLQADKAILSVLEKAGVNVEIVPLEYKENGNIASGNVNISVPDVLKAFEFDATDAPDLFPVLTLLAAFCVGRSAIKGVSRLLQKESNRAESIFTEFVTLGADIEIEDDIIYINGVGSGSCLHGGNVHSHNDHRIAMSLVIASLFIDEVVTIDRIECVDKSFPSFFKKLHHNILNS